LEARHAVFPSRKVDDVGGLDQDDDRITLENAIIEAKNAISHRRLLSSSRRTFASTLDANSATGCRNTLGGRGSPHARDGS
jgi:hypothetical protein